MNSPFAVLGIDETINAQKLEEYLARYMVGMVDLYATYASYFPRIKNIYSSGISSQKTERLLCKRYALGLELDKSVLGKQECKDLVDSLEKSDGIKENESENSGVSTRENRKDKRRELYSLSFMELSEMKGKIEKARQAYNSDMRVPKDAAPLMDVFVEIKYKEKIIQMADALAKAFSERRIACTEEEFRDAFVNMKAYQQLKQTYSQISTQEGRDMYIPERYIADQMAYTDYISTISPKRVEELLIREAKHASAHEREQKLVEQDPDLEEQLGIARNQKHDYAWGIILQPPTYLMYDEPVDSPIFKGKISVERLGCILEKSLFQKRRYVQEIQLESGRVTQITQRALPERLTIKQDTLPALRKRKTIREYFYRHEACKTLADHIYRVTKVDQRGIANESIIFSPVEYTGEEDPEFLEFMKKVYFSDLMLGIDATNGGYAGRIEQAPKGCRRKYFISNKYNEEEIASAVLFANGVAGTIIDKRNPEYVKRYEPANNRTLKRLLNPMERERGRELDE